MSAENEEFQISQEKEGNKLTVFLKGEINVATSKEFDDFINDNLEGVTELEFDLKEVDFVSSAGLRVFLNAQKIMDKQGSMLIPEHVGRCIQCLRDDRFLRCGEHCIKRTDV